MIWDDIYEVYRAVWALAEKDKYRVDNKEQYINMITELNVIFDAFNISNLDPSDKTIPIPKDVLKKQALDEWIENKREFESLIDDY